MRIGYRCEDCGAVRILGTTRTELVWLRNRKHVVQEVARHSSGGLDLWMSDGLEFLDEHSDHSVLVEAM